MPTKWPCDNAIDCPCADSNPLGNFSSEAPDPFTFFARRFFPVPFPRINDPPGVFVADGCGRACVSTISQEDADACALRAAVECTQPPPPGAPNDPVLFGNRALSCQALCPEGPPFTLSIPAGTYLARTQELADLIAQSFCQADVIRFRHCEMPPMPPPTPPGTVCPVIGTQTASPINANDGDDVTMTVNYTYNSSMMLMFVWFKDGVATYTTPSSTLILTAVNAGDQGQYILGIYASGCFPVFSSPIQLNVGCFSPTTPAAPKFNVGLGEYDYVSQQSVGVFAVNQTGNNNTPDAPNKNFTNIGALSAGWYQVFYRSGGTEFTDPFAVVFYDCDGFGFDCEVGGVPQVAQVDIPLDLTIYASCPLAEASVGGPDTDLTGIFETTATAGGAARVWGARYTTVPGWNMAVCDGSFPRLEIIHHVLETQPLDVKIANWDNVKAQFNMCPACQNRVGVEWDGSFHRFVYTPFDILYNPNINSATASLNGKRISSSSCEIILSEDGSGNPLWLMTLKCKEVGQPNGGLSGDIFWTGTKVYGRTPVGLYVSTGGACVAGTNPQCLTVEEV